MQQGKISVEWNSKSVINLIREIATQEEDGASKRIFAHAVKDVPVGKYGEYRYPGRRKPLSKRKKYDYSGKKKDWQKRSAGSLLRSIRRYESKFGQHGGKTVFAGNERLVYYAHFVEFGTVFMEKRRGYRFLRNAINRERRLFWRKLQERLAGDMR